MTKIALSTTLTLMAAAFGLSLLGGVTTSSPAAACYIGKPCPPPTSNRPWANLSGLQLQQIKVTPSNPRPSAIITGPRAQLETVRRR